MVGSTWEGASERGWGEGGNKKNLLLRSLKARLRSSALGNCAGRGQAPFTFGLFVCIFRRPVSVGVPRKARRGQQGEVITNSSPAVYKEITRKRRLGQMRLQSDCTKTQKKKKTL